MAYETLILERADGIATLTLNRPQALNALSSQVFDEMGDVLDGFDRDPPRVLVVTGAGRAFCAGADLAGGLLEDAGAVLETHYNPFLRRYMDLPFPVISSVNGAAAGAGCSIALSADFVIAGASAYFLQAFVNIGLVPDAGATWLLPRLAGRARAAQMMMLGERITPAQAADWGMIYKAVEDAELASETQRLAARLASGPTKAIAMIRHALRHALDASYGEVLDRERANQAIAGRTEDFREGVAAFLEKRPSNFTGR